MKPSAWLLALLAVLSAGLAYFASYAPVEVMQFSRDERPIQHSQREAYDFALQTLALYGGLPNDAQLVWSGGMERESFHPRETTTIDSMFQWRPRGLLASDDRILVEVRESSRGALFASIIIRNWHPTWWRALEQWWIQRNAVPIAAPLHERDSCTHGFDERAFLRVLGSPLTHLAYGGMGWPTPAPLSASRGARAEWVADIVVRARDDARGATFPLRAREAWVSDSAERPLPNYREVMLLMQPQLNVTGSPAWRWVHFASADVEHVCLQG